MNAENTLVDVQNILKQFASDDTVITTDSRLMQDLDLDSVKVMELLMVLEDHFDISIPLNLLPDITTVGDLSAQIDQLL